MSLGIQGLNLKQTIDPRINVQRLGKHLYGVETTGTENTYQIFPIQNFSSSGLTVVCNPPNRNVFIDTHFYLRVSFRITFTGTVAPFRHLLQMKGSNLQVPVPGPPPPPPQGLGDTYLDAPRAYPLSNALTNIQVTINGDPISTNLNEYIRALTRYHNDVECQDIYNSWCPTMLDQSLVYGPFPEGGTARDPLRGYGDNPLQCPRGGFIGVTVIRNDAPDLGGAATAIVDLNVMEPIYLSPLAFQCNKRSPAFAQIDTISVVAQFGGRGNTVLGGLVASLWSHSTLFDDGKLNTSVITSASVSVNNADIRFQYYTPPLDMVLPQSIVYPFVSPIFYSTEQASVGAGEANQTLNLQNVQLTSVPDRVYIWVSQRDQDNTISSTDTYFAINGVNITFNNRTGILSTAQQTDLFNICARNGCNESYRQFVKDVGSVLCLKFGEDIALPNLIVAGSRGSYNIQIAVNCTNNYPTAIIPTVNALFINTGTFTISNGVCVRQIGILTENDVLSARNTTEIPMEAPPALDALGGLKWGDIVNFFKNAARSALNVAKVAVPVLAPQYAPAVQGADMIARNIGFGKMRGGRKLTRKQMLAMM